MLFNPGPNAQEFFCREFPSDPVVRSPSFHCQGMGSIPGGGTKFPQIA